MSKLLVTICQRNKREYFRELYDNLSNNPNVEVEDWVCLSNNNQDFCHNVCYNKPYVIIGEKNKGDLIYAETKEELSKLIQKYISNH